MKTTVNCFRKSKISSESQRFAIAEDNEFLKELEKEIDSIQSDLVSENMDTVSFKNVGAEVLAVQPPASDTETVAELLETKDVSNDNDDAIETEDETVYCPDRNKLL